MEASTRPSADVTTQQTDTAEALGVSVRTVEHDWTFAPAWLYRALTGASR